MTKDLVAKLTILHSTFITNRSTAHNERAGFKGISDIRFHVDRPCFFRSLAVLYSVVTKCDRSAQVQTNQSTVDHEWLLEQSRKAPGKANRVGGVAVDQDDAELITANPDEDVRRTKWVTAAQVAIECASSTPGTRPTGGRPPGTADDGRLSRILPTGRTFRARPHPPVAISSPRGSRLVSVVTARSVRTGVE